MKGKAAWAAWAILGSLATFWWAVIYVIAKLVQSN